MNHNYDAEPALSGADKYYHAGGDLVAFDRSSGYGDTDSYGRRFVFRDHLGSTSVIVNGQGNTIANDLYLPYGDVRYQWRTGAPAIATQTQYRYTSQRMEVGVGAPSPVGGLDRGLYFYGARWYDASLARFVQPDTIVPEPGNPQSLNRYAYVLNNPLRYVDSNGHCGPLTPVCLALLLGGMALLLQGDSPDLNVTPEDVASQRLGGALFVGGAGLTFGAGAAGLGTQAAAAACADGDCTNEVRTVANAAQTTATSAQTVVNGSQIAANAGNQGLTVLGRYPTYLQVAERLKANVLNDPPAVWNNLTKAQQ